MCMLDTGRMLQRRDSQGRDSRDDHDGAQSAVALGRTVELFKALASPVRLSVIIELGTGPRCVHELSDALSARGREVSQPLLSQHLKVLREVGLVAATRRGTEITYELVDEHVAHIVNDAVKHSQEERT
jgi:ArsR family transcriptional regulator, zinc-responsive transcriptional repressor